MPKTFCVVGHDARQQAAARVLRRAGCGVTAADNAAGSGLYPAADVSGPRQR